jgi:hypothetical protein
MVVMHLKQAAVNLYKSTRHVTAPSSSMTDRAAIYITIIVVIRAHAQGLSVKNTSNRAEKSSTTSPLLMDFWRAVVIVFVAFSTNTINEHMGISALNLDSLCKLQHV